MDQLEGFLQTLFSSYQEVTPAMRRKWKELQVSAKPLELYEGIIEARMNMDKDKKDMEYNGSVNIKRVRRRPCSMTKEQYLRFAEDFFEECIETAKKKNHDYTGKTDDPFNNFKAVESLGIQVEVGFLTRMMDKMKRIASFVGNGELKVKDESVKDTLQDLANYAALLAGYLESEKMKERLVHEKKTSPVEIDDLHPDSIAGNGSMSIEQIDGE